MVLTTVNILAGMPKVIADFEESTPAEIAEAVRSNPIEEKRSH
jgi:hypothetical protein